MSRHFEIPHVVEIISPERFPMMSAAPEDRDAETHPQAEREPGERSARAAQTAA